MAADHLALGGEFLIPLSQLFSQTIFAAWPILAGMMVTLRCLCARPANLPETHRFSGTVHLIFQPAEEGRVGARAMIEDGLFEKYPCNEIYALHNWRALRAGTIATRPGPIIAAADTFELSCAVPRPRCATSSRVGHSAERGPNHDERAYFGFSPHQPERQCLLSMTRIQGGNPHNVLPSEVRLTGTVRSFDPAAQNKVEASLREVVEGVGKAAGCSTELEYIRYYPPT